MTKTVMARLSIEMFYYLVDNLVGVGWGNYEGKRFSLNQVYTTRESLLRNL